MRGEEGRQRGARHGGRESRMLRRQRQQCSETVIQKQRQQEPLKTEIAWRRAIGERAHLERRASSSILLRIAGSSSRLRVLPLPLPLISSPSSSADCSSSPSASPTSASGNAATRARLFGYIERGSGVELPDSLMVLLCDELRRASEWLRLEGRNGTLLPVG